EVSAPVGTVQLPVLFEFPDSETENAGQEDHTSSGDTSCQPQPQKWPKHLRDSDRHRGNRRYDELRPHRDRGKVLHRVYGRLNEKIKDDAQQVRQYEPD